MTGTPSSAFINTHWSAGSTKGNPTSRGTWGRGGIPGGWGPNRGASHLEQAALLVLLCGSQRARVVARPSAHRRAGAGPARGRSAAPVDLVPPPRVFLPLGGALGHPRGGRGPLRMRTLRAARPPSHKAEAHHPGTCRKASFFTRSAGSRCRSSAADAFLQVIQVQTGAHAEWFDAAGIPALPLQSRGRFRRSRRFVEHIGAICCSRSRRRVVTLAAAVISAIGARLRRHVPPARGRSHGNRTGGGAPR